MIVHFWNEIPNVTVHVTIARVDGDEPKKIIRLALKAGAPSEGTVLHAETLAPKERCKITFEQDGQFIELQDAAGFILAFAKVGDGTTEGIFRIEGLRQ